MAIFKFNGGGREASADNSTIGVQFNDEMLSAVTVKEAKQEIHFSMLGDKETMMKYHGDVIKKEVEIPIIDARNITDMGIDANGVDLVQGKWYAYDTDGAMTGDPNGYGTKELAKEAITVWYGIDGTGAEFDNGGAGYADEASAVAAATAGAAGAPYTARPITSGDIKSGNGNLYGGDTDYSVVRGSFPELPEEGGIVNQVGMKREYVSTKIKEYGFMMEWTKDSHDKDTNGAKLLMQKTREMGRALGEIREQMVQTDLLDASAINRKFCGDALAMHEVGPSDIVTFADIRGMQEDMKNARAPMQTTIITGSQNFDTKTIGSGYIAYYGQGLLPTLEDIVHTVGSTEIPQWVPIESYAAAGKITEKEKGKISNTRFIEVENMQYYSAAGANTSDGEDDVDSTNFKSENGHYNVYPILYVGDDSFATVGFAGDDVSVKYAAPKAMAGVDPYGKKASLSVAWHHGFLNYRPERIRQLVTVGKVS